MLLESLERYDDALDVLESLIKKDETNAAPRKRKIAILKAKGLIPEAIKELCDYLKKWVSLDFYFELIHESICFWEI